MSDKLIVEGTTEYGEYAADGTQAPFAVFDPERQDWLVTGLRWRWEARLCRWLCSHIGKQCDRLTEKVEELDKK